MLEQASKWQAKQGREVDSKGMDGCKAVRVEGGGAVREGGLCVRMEGCLFCGLFVFGSPVPDLHYLCVSQTASCGDLLV